MFTPITPASNCKRIALTNANFLVGSTTALHLSQIFENNFKDVELVCLAREDEELSELRKRKNIRVEEVDYDDETSLRAALQGVSCVILFLEMHARRVDFGTKIVDAMKKEHIDSCLMVSILGAGSSTLRSQQEYRAVEQQVEKSISNYVILRKAIISQAFLLWSHSVEEQNRFPVTTDQDTSLAYVDLIDVIAVIETIASEHCRLHPQYQKASLIDSFGKHTNKFYTLTGPEKTNPRSIVKILNAPGDSTVEFIKVTREELQHHFRSLSNQQGGEKVEVNQGSRPLDSYQEHHIRHAPPLPVIEIILDEYEWSSIDSTLSLDMREILGRAGRTLGEFFLAEKEAFRPRRAFHPTAKL